MISDDMVHLLLAVKCQTLTRSRIYVKEKLSMELIKGKLTVDRGRALVGFRLEDLGIFCLQTVMWRRVIKR